MPNERLGRPVEATLAERITEAWGKYGKLEEELCDLMLDVLGIDRYAYTDYPFESVGFDPSDWAGTSIELSKAKSPIIISPEGMLRIQEAGFDVICVHYVDGTRDRFLTPATEEHYRKLREKQEGSDE